MKRVAMFFLAAIFVLMAATLGWFLPLAAFNVDDSFNEGKQVELEIEGINLTYRDDLSIAQKIKIVNYEYGYEYEDAIELDKGIFLQKEDVKTIMEDFLADFTGYRFDILESNMYLVPMLVNLQNNRGTIVIWTADCWLTDGWEFQCYIDDRTGTILKSSFYGDPENWGSLIFGYEDMKDPCTAICEKYLNAIYNHYRDKIDAKFITYHILQDETDIFYTPYRLIFRDENDDTFQITCDIYVMDGIINVY